MSIPELAPPDVQVIQEFQTVSPTIVTPALMPCIVGPCNQYVEALVSGSINSSATVTLPAFAVSGTSPFTALGGKKLKFQYKTYTAEEKTFAATPANPTAAQVVEQVVGWGLTGITAQAIEDGTSTRVMFYTSADGDPEEFKFLEPSADSGMTILGLTKDYSYFGYSNYNQYDVRLPDVELPDPNSNLDELSVSRTSVRFFANTSGTNLTEAKRTQSILEPYGTATLDGTIALNGLSYPDDLIDRVFEATLEGESEKNVTFFATFREKLATGFLELVNNYETHRAKGAGTHGGVGGADADNDLLPATLAITSTSTLGEFTAAFADFKTNYDNHDNNNPGAYHAGGAGTHQTAVAAPTTWAQFITAFNDYRAKFNLHVEDLVQHTAADTADACIVMLIYLYNALAAGYTLHIANSAAGSYTLRMHIAPDTTNTLTYASLATTDLIADLITAVGDFRTKHDAHDATNGSAVHKVGAGGNAIIAGAMTTYADVLDVLHDNAASCFTQYNAHLVDTTEHYSHGDTYNAVTLTKDLATTDETTVSSEVNAIWSGLSTVNAGTHYLELSSTLGSITIGDGDANAVIGFTDDDYEYVVEAIDDSDGDTQTPYVRVQNADFTAASAVASHISSINVGSNVAFFPSDLTGKTVILGENGAHPQTITLSAAATTYALVLGEINAVMGAGFVSDPGGGDAGKIKAITTSKGYEAKIWFGNGTAHRDLGLPVNIAYYGTAFVPVPGDEFYQNGVKVGDIVQVAPDANVDQLKLNTEVANTYKKAHCYIEAVNIASGAATRPTPDLTTDGYYFDIKHDLVRDYRGQPMAGGTASRMIVSYNALRMDVSPQADNPALLVFESLSEVEASIPPIDTTNPLGLACSFTLANTPNTSISALGISETTTSRPEGTPTAYTEALEFLEAYDVYALCPLTQEQDVHTLFSTHVTALSLPARKLERMAIVNPALPTKELDTVVASGTDGESTATLNVFDTKLADLTTLLAAQGLNPAALTVDDGVYLDIETDTKRYNLSSVVGTEATVRVTFAATENTDNYFTTDNLPAGLLQETHSVAIKGAAISTKAEQVAVYYNLGQAYANRRLVNLVPGQVTASVSGVSTVLEGYYLGAAIAGMCGEQHPAQGFSNLPISGFTGVNYSWPYFSHSQLNQIAAGGNYIVYQPTSGGPLICRHQLTTDVSTVNKRELSILRAVDFSAKFYRLTVKSFVGVYNISTDTNNLLALTLQAASESLTDDEVIFSASTGKPAQSTTQSDKTEVTITLEVYVPNNYIEITLVV